MLPANAAFVVGVRCMRTGGDCWEIRVLGLGPISTPNGPYPQVVRTRSVVVDECTRLITDLATQSPLKVRDGLGLTLKVEDSLLPLEASFGIINALAGQNYVIKSNTFIPSENYFWTMQWNSK